MKLHELDALRRKEQVARVFETHLGHRLDFQRLTSRQAQHMLTRVRDLVREHRASPSRHYSERNPDYLKLVMMEQALASHVAEMDNMGAVLQDPKSKAVMDKAQRGQTLTPAEQATMNKIALAKEDQVNEKYMGFDKLEKAIKKGGSARDPGAVAAAIGRKKYGKEKFQKAAAAGKKLGEQGRTVPVASQRLQLERTLQAAAKTNARLAQSLKAEQDLHQKNQMRADTFGKSLSQLDQEYVTNLKKIADHYQVPVSIKEQGMSLPQEKSKHSLQKAAAGRKLGESLRLSESEIQTAQVVLAAQDMVDRIQGMMEDISEMQFKDLPALVNSIKNDMGVDQATQFQTQASAALSNLLTAVQAGKTEMESAQGVLTGQAPIVPGQDATAMPAAPAGEEGEVDLSLDANVSAGKEEEEEQVSVGLGRERR